MTTTRPLSDSPYTLKKDLFAVAILLLFCCLSYWPLTFHVFSLKNDAIIYFLPVRYQVSQSFYNGYFPFWSPYYNLGYPIHGDMQSGVWNPFVQLFSLFGPYTLYTLQLETLLYIFLSGLGMYFLLKHFAIHPLVNLMCATAYMLCGFNSDSAQYLLWISGSAFLPFVVLFFYRLLSTPSFFNSLLTGFFIWLLFATAYPAQFIVTTYLLMAMLIWKIWTTPKNSRGTFAKSLIKHLIAAILFFTVLSLPAIFSFMQYLPLTVRGSGASYEDAMSNPLHPLLVIAYIAPLSVFDYAAFEITDGLERNSFFGIFTFLFFAAAFFSAAKHKWVAFSKYAFVVLFIFSLGELGLLRILAYYTLPLMNSFRHPAMTKIFCIFFGVILAAFYLQKLFQAGQSDRKLQKVFTVIAGITICLGIWAIMHAGNLYHAMQLLAKDFNIGNTKAVLLRTFKTSLTFYDLLLINVLIQTPFLFLFYRFVIRKFNPQAIAWTGMFNCMVHALIFTFFTIVKTDSAEKIQGLIQAHTRSDYPIPSLTSSLQENSRDGMTLFKEIGILNMYNKKIGRVDYNIAPPNLLLQNDFWYNTGMRTTIMQYPFIYEPDTACSRQDKAAMRNGLTKKIVFLDDSVHIKAINNQPQKSTALAITQFNPNAIHLKYTAENNTFLVILQNRYPFWRATLDGRPALEVPVNSSFMGFAVPAGMHELHLDFRANHIFIAFIINLVCLLLFIVYLVRSFYRRGHRMSFVS